MLSDVGQRAQRGGHVLAVGLDVASVSAVRRAVETFGDAYLCRIFTPTELADCAISADSAPSLAARFAAKEAVFKVLALDAVQPPWTSIEVVRQPEGSCRLQLTGSAARIAERRGITDLLVSLSHEADLAAAIVVATSTVPPAARSVSMATRKSALVAMESPQC